MVTRQHPTETLWLKKHEHLGQVLWFGLLLQRFSSSGCSFSLKLQKSRHLSGVCQPECQNGCLRVDAWRANFSRYPQAVVPFIVSARGSSHGKIPFPTLLSEPQKTFHGHSNLQHRHDYNMPPPNPVNG